MRSPYQVGFFGVLFLVLLRVAIGWHFLNEGLSKHLSGNFSSDGFLSQAVGPFAGHFHALATDVHRFRNFMRDGAAALSPEGGDANQESADTAAQWRDEIARDWKKTLAEMTSALALDEAQQKQAESLLEAREAQLTAYFEEQAEDMKDYLVKLRRLHSTAENPHRKDLPFGLRWQDTRQRELDAMAGPWKSWVRDTEKGLREDLLTLANKDEQRERKQKIAAVPDESTAVDRIIPYTHIAAGVCLILGMLTRLASLGGAVFLASVILTQPPWVPGAAPMYNQVVEMTALLSFLFVPVGRWAGLDFFIHHLITRRSAAPRTDR